MCIPKLSLSLYKQNEIWLEEALQESEDRFDWQALLSGFDEFYAKEVLDFDTPKGLMSSKLNLYLIVQKEKKRQLAEEQQNEIDLIIQKEDDMLDFKGPQTPTGSYRAKKAGTPRYKFSTPYFP